MTFSRRTLLHGAIAVGATGTISRTARAQTYPSRPVHIVLGFPAGSPSDIIARPTAQALSERLGQQFVVDNRPGASGNIGAEAVAKASSDGYTLLLITTAYMTDASMYRHLNYDFLRDIAPVGSIIAAPYAMVVGSSFPAKTVPEFIAYAKGNPGKINLASPGIGSLPHIAGVLFEMMTGVDLVHVPYAGNYLPDLLSGQVQVAFSPIVAPIGLVRAGKLRALAVTGAKRSKALPDVPTIGEFVPGYEASGWLGIGAPKGISPSIVGTLNSALNTVIANSAFDERVAALGAVPMRMTPEEFGRFMAQETDKWTKVVKFAGIKPT